MLLKLIKGLEIFKTSLPTLITSNVTNASHKDPLGDIKYVLEHSLF